MAETLGDAGFRSIARQPVERALRTIWLLPLAWLILPILVLRPALDQPLSLFPIAMGELSVTPGVLLNLLVFACGAFVAAYLGIVRRRSVALGLTAALWGPLLIICLIASPSSPVPGDALRLIFNMSTYAAITLISAAYALPGRDIRLFRRVIVATGILPIFGGLVALALVGTDVRLQGLFTHPNIFAFFLMIYASFLYHIILSARSMSLGTRAFHAALMLLAMVCILFTQTRSAWLGLYVFMVLYTLLARPSLVLPIIAAPLLALAVPQVSERLAEALHGEEISYDYAVAAARGDVSGADAIRLDSGTWRIFLWQAAWDEAMQRPLTGHGFESFEPRSKKFFSLAAVPGSGAHNVYMQLLYETGFPGLIAFIWPLLLLLGVASFTRGAARRERAFAVSAIAAFAVVCYSDNMLHYLVVNWMFWFIIAGYAAAFLRHPAAREARAGHVTSAAGRRHA